KGQGICCFVILKQQVQIPQDLTLQLSDLVKKKISPIAKPDRLHIVSGLPKTRSGKIMRRILRKLADGAGDSLGDTSTLADPGIVEQLQQQLGLKKL
ncbi:MAG: acetyl-coenzyme A synthetase, partial [Bdellovibrio sp.]